MERSEGPRYRLLRRLGEGGFGVVYEARVEGPGGFTKQVAVKLLHAGLPEHVVARFRDEARILGLVRDRAIVAVEPPVLLEGRWALVMEFVDGASCAALLDEGPLPPTVALEIVGEVARALDVAWRQPGPDGRPLHLLHRDLKPANLQVTPAGQVKILDFGTARARFDAREAVTTAHVTGTLAYMAPERLRGVEGPAGDVWSLGVLLHELVVGERPGPEPPPGAYSARDAVVALADELRVVDPAVRPAARAVEERCAELATALEGPTLRRWAEEHVGHAPPADATMDRLLAATVEATAAARTPPPRTTPPRTTPPRRRGPLALGLGALALLAAGLGWVLVGSGAPTLENALRQPFLDFVMDPNATISERTVLRDPEAWDQALYADTVDHVERLGGRFSTWQRMDQVWDTWGSVVRQVRASDLPEVVAAVPWVESHYTPELQSSRCAKGLWQFMPETAHQAGPLYGTPLRVEGCRFEDGTTWQPTTFSVPRPPPYVAGDACRIPARRGCAVDERVDVEASTAAAIAMFARPWRDPDLRASGAAVQLALATHLLGYQGTSPGQPPTTVRPAYLGWASDQPDAAHPRVFAATRACQRDPACEPPLSPHAVDYVARALAAHFVAVCFYATNYAAHDAFAPWEKYTDGYCRSLEVPSRDEVAQVR